MCLRPLGPEPCSPRKTASRRRHAGAAPGGNASATAGSPQKRHVPERKSSAIAPDGLAERLRIPRELRVGHREPVPLLLVDGEDSPACAERGVHLGLDGPERGEAIPSPRARRRPRRARFEVPAKCRSLGGGSLPGPFGAGAGRTGLRRVIRCSTPGRDEELGRRSGQRRGSYLQQACSKAVAWLGLRTRSYLQQTCSKILSPTRTSERSGSPRRGKRRPRPGVFLRVCVDSN